jgi:predicted enzyme related to lactoylglutathione lyase
MSLIDGIGGAFLFSNDPKRLVEWYRDVFDISYDAGPDGRSFYKQFGATTWAILGTESDIAGKPRTGQINYRVTSIAAALASLAAKGVAVDKTEDHSYGKFAWITDPDGNKIELYEELS